MFLDYVFTSNNKECGFPDSLCCNETFPITVGKTHTDIDTEKMQTGRIYKYVWDKKNRYAIKRVGGIVDFYIET